MLQRWFAPRPRLTAQQAARLAAWQALPREEHRATFGRSRCVVVDVETTGLNRRSDAVIEIGLRHFRFDRGNGDLVEVGEFGQYGASPAKS